MGGFQAALERGWTLARAPVTDKGIFIAKFKRGKQILFFLNLGNWFKTSLKSLGNAFGLEKLEMPAKNAPFEDWLQYCKRDVEIVEKVMLEFIDFIHKNNLGGLSYTIAAQAFNSYCYNFMPCDIYIHAHEKAAELERKAYHGGRTEAFFIGKINEKVYELDVHSMYPSVMKDELFPVKLIKYMEFSSELDYKHFRDEGKLVIADVIVETPLPLVPFKNGLFGQDVFGKNGARLFAPVGKFRTVLTNVEIDFLLKNGGKVIEWGEMAVYEPNKIFQDYVNYFYSLKESAQKKKDKARYLLYKLFLNSLYGKFGQRSAKWKKIGTTDETDKILFQTFFDPENVKQRSMRVYAGIVEITEDEEDAFNSFTAIAAFVTAYAWVKLTHFIIEAGWENVYYCDTDSIFTNETGYKRLLEKGYIKDELGYLGLELVADSVTIFGLKDYKVNVGNREITKLKGVSKDSIIILTKGSVINIEGKDTDEFIKRCQENNIKVSKINGTFVIESGTISLNENEFGIITLKELTNGLDVHLEHPNNPTFLQTQWLSFAGHVRYKCLDKYLNRIIIKKLNREYNKGIITETGRVKPIELCFDSNIVNMNEQIYRTNLALKITRLISKLLKTNPHLQLPTPNPKSKPSKHLITQLAYHIINTENLLKSPNQNLLPIVQKYIGEINVNNELKMD